MLPDFPNAKRKIDHRLNRLLRLKIAQYSPIYALGQHKIIQEGDKNGIIQDDGEHYLEPFKHIQLEFAVPKADGVDQADNQFEKKISEAAEDMARLMEKEFLNKIIKSPKSADEAGGKVNTITPDIILEALSSYHVAFENDDRSRPIMPQIMVDPETKDALMNSINKLTKEEKDSYDKRHKEIMDRKYQEHLEDIKSRNIID